MESIWGAVAIAAGAVIGGLFNFFSTKNTNDKQEELMREQNEFNAAQVDKMNAYNDPSAQKARISNAGLNPAFFFGHGGLDNIQSSPAQASSIPSLNAPQIDTESISRQLFEKQRVKNETLKTDAEIDKYLAESESLKLATQQAKDSYDDRMKNLNSQTFKNDADRREAEQRIKTEYVRRQEIYKNIESMDYNNRLLLEKARTERWTQNRIEAEIERMYQLTPIEANVLKSQYHLNDKNAAVAAEQINKVNQEYKNAIKEGRRVDAVTYSQWLDNAVKDAQSTYDIEVANMKADNPTDWAIIDQLSGVVKNSTVLSTSVFQSSSNKRRKIRAQQSKYNSLNGSSWMFND